MLRRALVLAPLVLLVLGGSPAGARPRAVIAFWPGATLDALAAHSALSLGLASATQGGYTPEQALLDLTSGARTSRSTYDPEATPRLGWDPVGRIRGWDAAVRRADSAPADVRPGLLAASIPSGAAYVAAGPGGLDAVAASDRRGRVAAVSLGPAVTLPARVARSARRLVVADLPGGRAGGRSLAALLSARRAGELVIVLRAPPPRVDHPLLLPVGAAGLGAAGALTSDATRRRGVVALVDVAPTVLDRLGRPVPDAMAGSAIRREGGRDVAALHELEARWSVVPGRRLATLAVWALAALLALPVLGLRRGARLGALALYWIMPLLLLTAWLGPASEAVELAILVGGGFALAAVTDRLAAWPRALGVPAGVGALAYAIDLAGGSALTVRSLLGPNPRSGSRFYGIGNELEIGLAVMVLVALAAVLPWRERSARTAGTVAAAGLVATAWLAAGGLGADVGAVFTMGGGTAAAVLLLAPGGASRRRVALAAGAVALALALLLALDAATGGGGHFAHTVSSGGLGDAIRRRSELAWENLVNAFAPVFTLLALAAAAFAVRRRDRVYAALHGDPVWLAALGGGLAASILGTLTNDSGPTMLIIGVFGLALATAYLAAPPLRS